jgi:hypothetical protein
MPPVYSDCSETNKDLQETIFLSGDHTCGVVETNDNYQIYPDKLSSACETNTPNAASADPSVIATTPITVIKTDSVVNPTNLEVNKTTSTTVNATDILVTTTIPSVITTDLTVITTEPPVIATQNKEVENTVRDINSFLDPILIGKVLNTGLPRLDRCGSEDSEKDKMTSEIIDEVIDSLENFDTARTQANVWSIFTETPSYPKEESEHSDMISPVSNKMTEKWKDRLSNEKFKENFNLTRLTGVKGLDEPIDITKHPLQDLSVPIPEPNSSGNEKLENVDIPCERVQGKTTPSFDAHTDITTTYMYSRDTPFKLFQELSISLSPKMMTNGSLLDGTPMNILFDTGATCSIIAIHYVERNSWIRNYPRYKVPAVSLTIGDGTKLQITEALKVPIFIGEHCLEIVAWLTPIGRKIDLVFGVKSMLELEGKMDIATCQFTFKSRSIPIQFAKRITVPPGKDVVALMRLPEIPADFTSGELICKLETKCVLSRRITHLVEIHYDECYLGVENDSDHPLTREKGHTAGYADFRSIGYLYLSRTGIEIMLGPRFLFVGEESEPEIGESEPEKEESETEEILMVEMASDQPPKPKPDIPVFVKKRKKAKRLKPCPDLYPDKETKLEFAKHSVPEEPKITKQIWRHGFLVDENDPFPWLVKDDERRFKTDSELIRGFIPLDKAHLSDKGKEDLYSLCEQYRPAFSLRDELGECKHLEIDIELKDDTPFFIRPYPAKETDKMFIDKEMRKGCLLGILRKGLSSYSSPIMLITRKQGGIPRIVTDFRFLNSRLKILQCSLPLMRDAIQTLGASVANIASIIDLRDAFHTLRIQLKKQKYCGITPYFGSPTYIYQRLPMGLSISPAIFMFFITKVLDEIRDREHFIAIMDDILIHSKYEEHMACLEKLFQTLIRHGLKISPKKCQFFQKDLVYMGLKISYQEGRPTLAPTKDKIEAIEKVPPLLNVDAVRSFCGMVNYLSMFCKDLQTLLVPIYELLRKGKKWHWSIECQDAFAKIKETITHSPVLVMPDSTGHFTLVSDTSKEATGAALYQRQGDKDRLVSYHSKRLNQAAERYSISELELHGLAINVKAFRHYLTGIFFSIIIDHSALVYILKAKREPPTLRIKKLIESLSAYNFEVNFLKGKEMFVSDFLSRHAGADTSNPNIIDPIMLKMIKETYTSHELKILLQTTSETHSSAEEISPYMKAGEPCFLVSTRNQTRKEGEQVRPIYPLTGSTKKPQHEPLLELPRIPITPPPPQIQAPRVFKNHDPEPIEQGPILRQETQRQRDPNHVGKTVNFPLNLEQRREYHPQQPPMQMMYPQRPLIPTGHVPIQLHSPNVGPPTNQQPPSVQDKLKDLEIFKNQRPLEIRLRGFVPPHDDYTDYRQPDVVLFNEKKKLFETMEDSDIVMKHLPHQSVLHKYIDKLKLKVLHNYDLPLTIKELVQEAKRDPFFKDIYRYLTKGQYPENKAFKSRQKDSLRAEANDYILAQSVLFKIKYASKDKTDPELLLCIPEKYVPALFYHYHDMMLAAHQGVIRMYLTLRAKFFTPHLFDNIRKYIQCCYQCQSRKDKANDPLAFHVRIPYDFRPMKRISCDIKYMPISAEGDKYILFACCEFSNYVVGIPMKERTSIYIAEALLNKVVYQFGPPAQIIIDMDSALKSELMMHLYNILGIDIKIVSPENHGSNRVERYIRTVSDMLCKTMSGKGDNWYLYCMACCYAHNTYVTPTLDFCPHELVYLHKPANLTDLKFDPLKHGDRAAKDYMNSMKDRFDIMKTHVIDRKLKDQKAQLAKENRLHLDQHVYAKGDLVYFFAPRLTELETNSRKFKASWIGPLKITQILDDSHYMIGSLDGRELKLIGGAHIRMLKPYVAHFGEMRSNHLVTYRNMDDIKHITKQQTLRPV